MKNLTYTSAYLRYYKRFTSNLVDILEGQSQRLVCWSFRWKDAVECLKQSETTGITLLSLN